MNNIATSYSFVGNMINMDVCLTPLAPEAIVMKKSKILIVENESIIAKDLEVTIKKMGWKDCQVVFSGEAAIAHIIQQHPDIILMDIKLGGGLDGIDVAEQIAAFSDIPIIYLTAYTDDDVLVRAKDTRPYGYIVKPFEERNLQVNIEMALYKHQAEKKLREKDKWMQRIIENLEEGLIAVDKEMRVQLMNPPAESLTGLKKSEAIGLPVDQVIKIIEKNSQERVRLPFQETMTLGTMVSLSNDMIMESAEGNLANIDGKCFPVADEDGNISGAMLVFHDITRKEQLERRVRQSQKMEAIGTLTGGIAHDFNNLLSVILGYSELLLRQMSQDRGSKTYHSIDQVVIAAKRARELVKQILAFSRQSEDKRKPIRVTPLVNEALKLMKPSLPENIKIHRSIHSEEGTVIADATQLYQVLMNLFTNAIFAMKEKGGVLDVSLEEMTLENDFMGNYGNLKAGCYLKLSVGDTGSGIPSEVMPRIFEPFFTTKNRDEGTGMGLAVVYGIIQGHRGGINVRSTPGQGSVFDVFFPLAEISGKEGESEPAGIRGGNECILFVDDEQTLVELGIELLGQLGYRIIGRTSSIMALEDFYNDPDAIDLAIVDLVMPRMNGTQLAQRLLEIRPGLPIILCTGFSNATAVQEARNAGIVDVIMKPIILKEIAPRIRELLDQQKKKT